MSRASRAGVPGTPSRGESGNAIAGPSTPAPPASAAAAAVRGTPGTPATPMTPSAPGTGARRLRARASEPGPAKKPRTTGTRIITADEEARAIWKLSADGTAARREDAMRELEARVRAIVDKHDMAVREKFHLERYVSILEGWDPAEAKVDNSAVFLEYKNLHHDLLSLVGSVVMPIPMKADAGPSVFRTSGPSSRTTRRQLHQKSEALGHVTALADKGRRADKGKGKAKAEVGGDDEPAEPSSSRSRKKAMPPPPAPAANRKSRRATTHGAAAEADSDDASPAPAKGKKRGRQSMPSLPSKKARALETASPASSPAPTPIRSPTPEPPAPLPSLAHLPFPPPPPRAPHRLSGAEPTYTDPMQRPPPARFGRDADALLESYISVDDGASVDLAALEARAAREGYIRNRVNWLQHQGRLLRLLDEEEEKANAALIAENKQRAARHERRVPIGPPPRKTDHHDALLAHMTQVRHAIIADAKMKPVVCRKIARMIQLHWEHIHTKDERAAIAEERERKRKAKEVVKALKKRWGLAIKIIRAKVREAQKLEQDRLGKVHLQNMLQRSTGLLEGQRDAMAGREGDEEEEDEEEEDGEDEGAQSDATADVSAAEDSEGEGGDEGVPDEGAADVAEREKAEIVPDQAVAENDNEASEDEDEGEDGDEEDDGSESGSDAEEEDEDEPKVDYHAMLGIRPDEATSYPGESDAPAEEDTRTDAVPEEPDTVPAPAEAAQATSENQPDAAAQPDAVAPTTVPAPAPAETTAEPAASTVPAPASQTVAEPAASTVPPETPAEPITEAMDVDVDVPFAEVSYGDITMDEIDASFGPTPVSLSPAKPDPEYAPEAKPEASAPTSAASSSPPRSPTPPPRAPSRRLAKRASALAAAAATPDPDANDAEFTAVDTSAADARLDDEMEGANADGGDSEDEGLLADAEVPIEVLLKRYGYPMPEPEASEADGTDAAEGEGEGEGTRKQEAGEDASDDERAVADLIEGPDAEAPHANGSADASAPVPASETAALATETAAGSSDVKPDQSLTDQALAQREPSPALIVEGKRQRKARRVWTPPDTPQHAVGKPRKPKVQIVEAEAEAEAETEVSPEHESSEPESSEEEEEDEDEDEEMEEEAAEENPNAPRIRPPFLLRGILRPYQQAGLEWLASLYANNMNGILADEMGLGKTIQTISLLGHLACDKGVWGPHLIIVPTSVILNWEMEFKKFLPGMKVLTYYGNQKERKEKRVGWNTENAWQVCITSYQIVLADQHIFRRKNWVYMILDEAHNIKNFRSQRWQTLLGFKAQRRLLLTGTPLQNNLMELWSLLYFLMPNGITADATAVVGFANHRDFMEWFSNPMDKAVETGDTMDEEMIATVNKLHTLLRPFILRRLKADVEKQLPGKFEHVVYCRLSKRQRFLYDEFMSRASTREALASGGYMGVMNTLMQLRKVCNHPDLFEVRPVRTSFATDRGVLSDFEPMDVLVRKRLLAKHDELDLDEMGFLVTQHEQESGWVARSRSQLNATDKLPYALEPAKRGVRPPRADMRTVDGWAKYRAFKDHAAEVARWHSLRDVNRRRCAGGPIFGRTALEMFTDIPRYLLPESVQTRRQRDWFAEHTPPAAALVQSLPERLASLAPIVDRFAVIPPNAVVRDVAGHALPGLEKIAPELHEPGFDTLHPLSVKLQIAFPDVSLLQYDCGKLQKLAEMLRNLKAEGHRVLIFTQMTRVLDILEIFLSYSGHRYLRLDGSTKIEDRQVLTERFNSDARIFCFIASSRSGGVGINLTGADTVFFYDSDWNPSMDRQCMDRAHRIGQTREVHIYRFVSTHTVEENMLKKANQKRLLDRVVIQDGEFTTDFFGRMDWRDMLDDTMMPENADEDEGSDRIEDVEVEPEDDGDVATAAPRSGKERELALALAQVEDEEDAAAARVAQGEGEMDFADFDDEGKKARREDAAERTEHERTRDRKGGKGKVAAPLVVSAARSARLSHVAADSNTPATQSGPGTPLAEGDDDADGGYGYADDADADADADDYYDEDEPGAIDEYMLRYVEWEWSSYFCNL